MEVKLDEKGISSDGSFVLLYDFLYDRVRKFWKNPTVELKKRIQ